MELNERKKTILKAVIDAYIERGEPVGSKYLVDYCHINLSAATIRNAMNELEQMGLLEQPHTSAGRIPSTMGYRIYVDNLMQGYLLSAKEIKEINDNIQSKIPGLNNFIEQSVKLLSTLTSMMSVSMASKVVSATISRFETLLLDTNNFLLILITSVNIVKTKHIHSKLEINTETLSNFSKVFNQRLAGRTAEMISLPLILEIENLMGAYSYIVSPILKIVYEAITDIDNARLYFDGITNLLKYPEYHDIDKAREIISLIDEQDLILKILSDTEKSGLRVYIGGENNITSVGDTSFIFKTFSLNDKMLGTIGVIGPKRMDYSKIIAKLEYLSGTIAGIIDSDYNLNDNITFYDK